MSNQDAPIATLFELQRETIRQTGEITAGLLELPEALGEGLSEGAATQREFQEQGLELARQSIHRSLDATEAFSVENVDIDSLRDRIDETFDAIHEHHDQTVDDVEAGYEELNTDLADAIDEQVSAMIELNERVETQLTETVDQLTAEVEDSEELTEQLETQLETLSEQFERQLEQFEQLAGQLDTGDGDGGDSNENRK